MECQTEGPESLESENCENCLPATQVKSLTSEGTALKELKRIKNMSSDLDKSTGPSQPGTALPFLLFFLRFMFKNPFVFFYINIPLFVENVITKLKYVDQNSTNP